MEIRSTKGGQTYSGHNSLKGRLIINVSEHSSILDRKLLPQISIFFPNSKSLLKYTLK
jgi:hypothetical protein